MTTILTIIQFEICETCGDEWTQIDTDTLQRKLTAQEIDMMVGRNVTIRKGMEKYRRYFPAEVYDWAKHDYTRAS
jgi:hypothetical protein